MSKNNNIISRIIAFFKREEIVIFDKLQEEEKKGKGFFYKGREFIHHSELELHEMAFHRFSGSQIVLIISLILCLLIGLYLNWHTTIIVFVAFLTFLYFADLLFNLFLIIRSFSKDPEIKIDEKEINEYKKEWPMYTILCPLYKEAHILPQFIKAMTST